MAKVPFSKLNLKIDTSIRTVVYKNSKNETIEIEVKSYLPVEEKLDMISNIINQSIDDKGYYNPMRLKIYTTLEMIQFYTNLTFTSKQKENVFKLYDVLISENIFQQILDCICENDYQEIQETLTTVIENIYKYKNSAMGILEMITSDYSNLQLNASEIQKELADPNNMSLLRDVLSKLG